MLEIKYLILSSELIYSLFTDFHLTDKIILIIIVIVIISKIFSTYSQPCEYSGIRIQIIAEVRK